MRQVGRRGRARIGAALTGALLLAGLAACGDEEAPAEPDTTASATPPPPSATGSPTEEPTISPEEPQAFDATVWFVVDSRAGVRLVREQREVAGTDPAVAAVEAMIAGPEDPDYTSTWNPEAEVRSVNRDGDLVVVDLSEEVRTADVGSEGAALMVQQLVHTVTDAVGRRTQVMLHVEGEPAGELWGAVTWDAPERRARALDVRLLVQIDSPREASTVVSPVRVKGEAAAFEATVLWRVLDAAGDEVASGSAMTREGMRMSPYSFEVELEPGTYVVEVQEDDPSGGEGGTEMSDSKSFVVE